MARIKGKIVVDTARCKGCSVCVDACPFDAIALAAGVNSKGYNYCETVAADACTGCASCALVCPDGCITVYRQKPEQP